MNKETIYTLSSLPKLISLKLNPIKVSSIFNDKLVKVEMKSNGRIDTNSIELLTSLHKREITVVGPFSRSANPKRNANTRTSIICEVDKDNFLRPYMVHDTVTFSIDADGKISIHKSLVDRGCDTFLTILAHLIFPLAILVLVWSIYLAGHKLYDTLTA